MKGLMKKYKKTTVVVLVVVLWFGWVALYDHVINVAPFEKKVVLITGTASGIGKATAEHLIAQGYIVYGGDIQFEKNKYLDNIGGHSLDMDVTDKEMVQAGVDKIIAEQGQIDVLFNNAGYGLFGTVEEVSIEDARQQFEVNFFGYTNLIQAVMPHMRKQGDGLIINNSSMGGRLYFPLGAWYHGTKYAVEVMSDALRYEVAEFGVDVVLVEPGFINTNFYNVSAQYYQKYGPTSAYQHIYQPLFESDFDPSEGSDPIVIAETVEEAIRAKTPKTRYLRGNGAKFFVFMKTILSDRMYDRFVSTVF